jgi:hypothetical protein
MIVNKSASSKNWKAALNLDNIISILILCQHAYRLQYLIHNYLLCFWISTVLKYSLYREKKTVNLINTRDRTLACRCTT